MKTTYTFNNAKNGTEITLYLNLDKNNNHNGTYELKVIDVNGTESDKYDYHFTSEKSAVMEYNQAVKDNN